MYSWWWVRMSPETCRVKPLRRIKTQLLHLVGLISLLQLLLFWTKHFIHSVKFLEIRPLKLLLHTSICILVLWNGSSHYVPHDLYQYCCNFLPDILFQFSISPCQIHISSTPLVSLEEAVISRLEVTWLHSAKRNESVLGMRLWWKYKYLILPHPKFNKTL